MKISTKNVNRLILISFAVAGLIFGIDERISLLADWELRHAHQLGKPSGLHAFTIMMSPFIFLIYGLFLGFIVSKLYSYIASKCEKNNKSAGESDV